VLSYRQNLIAIGGSDYRLYVSFLFQLVHQLM